MVNCVHGCACNFLSKSKTQSIGKEMQLDFLYHSVFKKKSHGSQHNIKHFHLKKKKNLRRKATDFISYQEKCHHPSGSEPTDNEAECVYPLKQNKRQLPPNALLGFLLVISCFVKENALGWPGASDPQTPKILGVVKMQFEELCPNKIKRQGGRRVCYQRNSLD